ncbi:MAG: hypothetical protein FWD83_07160 [Promicromonosporaceae bacterium]|nr:hypothetical protein [Promicromonosporaceae bacterium]
MKNTRSRRFKVAAGATVAAALLIGASATLAQWEVGATAAESEFEVGFLTLDIEDDELELSDWHHIGDFDSEEPDWDDVGAVVEFVVPFDIIVARAEFDVVGRGDNLWVEINFDDDDIEVSGSAYTTITTYAGSGVAAGVEGTWTIRTNAWLADVSAVALVDGVPLTTGRIDMTGGAPVDLTVSVYVMIDITDVGNTEDEDDVLEALIDSITFTVLQWNAE